MSEVIVKIRFSNKVSSIYYVCFMSVPLRPILFDHLERKNYIYVETPKPNLIKRTLQYNSYFSFGNFWT
jgi:hypothetical protein